MPLKGSGSGTTASEAQVSLLARPDLTKLDAFLGQFVKFS